MMKTHLLHFSQQPPQNSCEGGYRIRATKSTFPILQGMSLYQLVLQERGIREPHWHANADELGYCLKGAVLVSLYGNNNHKETFLVNAGEAFFIPSGALHCIENTCDVAAELILQFSHEEPEDFGISSVFGMFSDAVLGNTWSVTSDKFATIKRTTKEVFAALQDKIPTINPGARYSSDYHYNVEASSPLVANEGGSARVARFDHWPILTRQALYSLKLTGTGMREPHWHPETAEMGYVKSGKGRMAILSPSGNIDRYEMGPGDIYFIPKAYPHHIENLAKDPLEIIIFFDQAMPQDIGFTGSIKSFTDEVLSSVLGGTPQFYQSLPQYYSDLFIVNKTNPLD